MGASGGVASAGPADRWNGYRCCSGGDTLLYWDFTGNEPKPNIAKDWELSADGRQMTIFLREGMRWSDGEPFTAEDFMFWFEDMYGDEDLVPVKPSYFTINGKPGVVEKVNDYTVNLNFPDPYFLLPDVLAGSTQLGGQAHQGRLALGLYAPKHYLQQFHPKHVGQEAADKLATDAGYDNWVNFFKSRNDWAQNVDLPVLSPWKTVISNTETTWVLERNPYSVWTDTEGNQLPYIDRVSLRLFENLEVHNLRAIAGEYDMQARHIDIQKVPVFLENEEKGNYKLYLDPGDYGGDMIIKFNLSYAEDPEIRKWIDERDFRRALSLGIDRDQINETFWLGIGVPRSVVPASTNLYYPGPKYDTLWATHDPDRANQMLDAIGLDKKDGDGFRLRSDGKGRLAIEVITYGGQFVQYTQIMEAIGEQWEKIGIKLEVKEVERGLGAQLFRANKFQTRTWNNDGSEHMFTFPGHVFAFDAGSTSGPLHGLWFQTNGAEGEEPPTFMKTIMSKWRKAFGVPREERVALAKEIWAIAADEVYIIGVIGLGPASMGVRVAKTDLGNIPSRMYNSPDGKTPGISRTMTFYWKSQDNRQPQPLLRRY